MTRLGTANRSLVITKVNIFARPISKYLPSKHLNTLARNASPTYALYVPPFEHNPTSSIHSPSAERFGHLCTAFPSHPRTFHTPQSLDLLCTKYTTATPSKSFSLLLYVLYNLSSAQEWAREGRRAGSSGVEFGFYFRFERLR
jgi:hypothetical protein